MNCEEVMELMQRHVDGDLNAEETLRMLDHVGHCPECAVMLQKLTNLSRGLEQLPRVVPPYSLVDAILPQLEDGEAAGAETAEEPVVTAPRGRRGARTRKEWIGRLAGVAAVAAVVMLLMIGGPNLLPMGSSHMSKEAGLTPTSDGMTNQSNNKDTTKPKDVAPSARASMGAADASASGSAAAPASPSAEPSASMTTKAAGTNEAQSPSPSPERNPESSSSPTPSAGRGDQKQVDPRASEEPHDKGKGIPVPSTQPSSPPPTAMLMQQPPDEDVLSPDGQWRAVIREGLIQLIRTGDGSLAYESPPGDGKRSGVVWKDDSSAVNYTYTDSEGETTSMYVDVSELQEKTAP